jgi:hypothetical protein
VQLVSFVELFHPEFKLKTNDTFKIIDDYLQGNYFLEISQNLFILSSSVIHQSIDLNPDISKNEYFKLFAEKYQEKINELKKLHKLRFADFLLTLDETHQNYLDKMVTDNLAQNNLDILESSIHVEKFSFEYLKMYYPGIYQDKLYFYSLRDNSFLQSTEDQKKGDLKFLQKIKTVFNKEKRIKSSYYSVLRNYDKRISFPIKIFTDIIKAEKQTISEYLLSYENLEVLQSTLKKKYYESLNLDQLEEIEKKQIELFFTNNLEVESLFNNSYNNNISSETTQPGETDTNHEIPEKKNKDSKSTNDPKEPLKLDQLLLKQMNEKDKTLKKVLNKTKSVKSFGMLRKSNEESKSQLPKSIILGSSGAFRLRNFKYRSNASMRRGKILLTDSSLVTYRRKFSLFPTFPFYAFLRINNRMIFLLSKLGSFIAQAKPFITVVARAIGPLIIGSLAFLYAYVQRIDLPEFLFFEFPALVNIIYFGLENPQLFASIGGVTGGLGYGFTQLFRILFLRARAVSIISFPMILGLSTQNHYRRTRSRDPVVMLKPMGSQMLPGTDKGVPFRTNFKLSNLIDKYKFENGELLFNLLIGVIPFFNQKDARNESV